MNYCTLWENTRGETLERELMWKMLGGKVISRHFLTNWVYGSASAVGNSFYFFLALLCWFSAASGLPVCKGVREKPENSWFQIIPCQNSAVVSHFLFQHSCFLYSLGGSHQLLSKYILWSTGLLCGKQTGGSLSLLPPQKKSQSVLATQNHIKHTTILGRDAAPRDHCRGFDSFPLSPPYWSTCSPDSVRKRHSEGFVQDSCKHATLTCPVAL